jgi:hypothetical protein
LLAFGGRTLGAVTLFQGRDDGAIPGSPLPNSKAAAARFDSAVAAIGVRQIIDFESLPVNVPVFKSPLALGQGVSVEFSGGWHKDFTGVTNATGTSGLGFNVTPNGSHYLEIKADANVSDARTSGTVTFQFSTPIQAFGSYIGGTGTGGVPARIVLSFNDGTSRQFPIPNQGADNNTGPGGMQFWGFVDAGAAISSVVIVETTVNTSNLIDDSFGMDDIRYLPAGCPPGGERGCAVIPIGEGPIQTEGGRE